VLSSRTVYSKWDYPFGPYGIEKFYIQQGWRYHVFTPITAHLPGAAALARQAASRQHPVMTLQDFRELYLMPLKALNVPGFVNQCRQVSEDVWPELKQAQEPLKTMVMVPRGAARGLAIVLNMRRGKDGAPTIESFADVAAAYPYNLLAVQSAGLWEQGAMGANAEELFGGEPEPAVSVAPGDLDGVVSAAAKYPCATYHGGGSLSTARADADRSEGGGVTMQGFVDVLMQPLKDRNIPVRVAV
jgi:hypothetical protein